MMMMMMMTMMMMMRVINFCHVAKLVYLSWAHFSVFVLAITLIHLLSRIL